MLIPFLYVLSSAVICSAVFYMVARPKVAVLVKLGIASFAVAAVTMAIGYAIEVYDTEVRSGRVIAKSKETVSCSHSYSCGCDSKGNCSTCYEHSHDYDWVVETTIPYTFVIDRVDRQGAKMPPRWASVKLNDPVADTFSFVNYRKAAKYSVFNRTFSSADIGGLPSYPMSVNDYYHVNRLVNIGSPINLSGWTHAIQDLNASVGPSFQANVILVMASNQADLANKLDVAWNGAKKNDVVVVMQTEKDGTIAQVDIISWTDSSTFKVELTDALYALKTISNESISDITKIIQFNVIKSWKRKRNSEYSYLSAEIDISPFAYIIAAMLAAGVFVIYTLNETGAFSRGRGARRFRSRY